jgi:hypothetical protein
MVHGRNGPHQGAGLAMIRGLMRRGAAVEFGIGSTAETGCCTQMSS